ncbi:MAG: TonB family protein [Candidatus Aminicenantes bacterium]|nr:TonB family protein [Candidatus Aminicenantes bacterium]
MKKLMTVLLILLFIPSAPSLYSQKEENFVVKSHLLRGARKSGGPGSDVIVSSSSNPFFVPSTPGGIASQHMNLTDLKNELMQIYHLEGVDHITSRNMIWRGSGESLVENVLIGNDLYEIHFSPKLVSRRDVNLKIEVSKLPSSPSGVSPSKEAAGKIVLRTEVVLNLDAPIVMGFPSDGESYFLSLAVNRFQPYQSGNQVFPRKVTEINLLAPPKPVKQVQPSYPEALKIKGIEGTVILEIKTDEEGNIIDIKVIKSVHPELDHAAVSALKQWKYEPALKEGKPVSVVFTVSVDYKLDKKKQPAAAPTEPADEELSRILDRCTKYCDRLAAVSLDFICKEKIEEEIYTPRESHFFTPHSSQMFTSNTAMKKDKHKFLYDYQLIRKENTVKEQRILLEENGKKTHVENVPLETSVFKHRFVLFGPLGLLSRDMQAQHDFKFLKEEKFKGKPVYVIEAVPKSPLQFDHLFGKIFIDKENFSILRIEWDQESLQNYDIIEVIAQKLNAKPKITLITEFAFEKNGIRFPSLYAITETYISKSRGRRFTRSTTEVEYSAYQFFTVDTEIKY